jgi:hypothetical protein
VRQRMSKPCPASVSATGSRSKSRVTWTIRDGSRPAAISRCRFSPDVAGWSTSKTGIPARRSGRRHRKGAAARCPGRARLRDRARSAKGSLSTGRAALFGQRRDCDPVPGSAASAKRISAERECEPVFFMTAARWFSTVRWLMNAGPAAREPHRPVADVVLPYAVKSYREALHCCDTGFFRRCSRPNQDGALLSRQSRNQRGDSIVRRCQSCREPDDGVAHGAL